MITYKKGRLRRLSRAKKRFLGTVVQIAYRAPIECTSSPGEIEHQRQEVAAHQAWLRQQDEERRRIEAHRREQSRLFEVSRAPDTAKRAKLIRAEIAGRELTWHGQRITDARSKHGRVQLRVGGQWIDGSS